MSLDSVDFNFLVCLCVRVRDVRTLRVSIVMFISDLCLFTGCTSNQDVLLLTTYFNNTKYDST